MNEWFERIQKIKILFQKPKYKIIKVSKSKNPSIVVKIALNHIHQLKPLLQPQLRKHGFINPSRLLNLHCLQWNRTNLQLLVTKRTTSLTLSFWAFGTDELSTAFLEPFFILTVFTERVAFFGLEGAVFVDDPDGEDTELFVHEGGVGNFESLVEELL